MKRIRDISRSRMRRPANQTGAPPDPDVAALPARHRAAAARWTAQSRPGRRRPRRMASFPGSDPFQGFSPARLRDPPIVLHGYVAYMWTHREAPMETIRSHAERRGLECRHGFCTISVATAANWRNVRSPEREVLSP